MKNKTKKFEDNNLALIGTLGFLVLCIFVLFLTSAWLYLQPKGRVSCGSFSTWEDANRAYSAGATWLDKGGVPGRPCESLYNRDNKK